MRQKVPFALIMAGLTAITALTLYGHSGRTDANGGHYNRKTGEYHYHNSGRAAPSYTLPTISTTPARPATRTVKTPDIEQRPSRIAITENHWQVGLNNNFFRGRLEVPVGDGKADIVTAEYVVEVDKVSKYAEGIEQALRYSRTNGKKPVLALYIDGEANGLKQLQLAEKLCEEKGITLVLANCYVTVEDLFSLASVALTSTSDDTNAGAFWLNTSSGVRHNSSCRYYMNTKSGRKCSRSEGRACGICGG